jgi:cytochrome b subunit of formate dehydrogenase
MRLKRNDRVMKSTVRSLISAAGTIAAHVLLVGRNVHRWGAADKEWLDNAKYYVTNQHDKVPAQGKYNAGQKLFYWAMFYGAFVLLFSGAFMCLIKTHPSLSASMPSVHP